MPDKQKKDCAFSSVHPGICFTFFACALILGMCFRHPIHLLIALAFSTFAFLSICGQKAWSFLAAFVPMFVIVAFINPIINAEGNTVLFTYLNRPYTFEALMYGCCIAAMLVSMMIWIACYTSIMTSDKHTYLFGSIAPAASLVFCMVLRLIPHYERRTVQMAHAREGIGASIAQDTTPKRLQSGMSLMSGLVTWALEDAVVSADSMRARGYGATSLRSSYARYRMTKRDIILLSGIIALTALSAICYLASKTSLEFFPAISLGETNNLFALSCIYYLALLSVPTLVNLRESITWRNSLSNK